MLLDSATKLEIVTKLVFNGFGSTDSLLAYLEKLRITIAANQSSCGKIPDGITALNLTFQESAVRGCWCETYWLKEVYPEATAARESAHSELIKKMTTQAEAETDDKKKKALLAKLANIQGSYIAYQDSEMKLV